jgi:hypothetical protein
MSGGLDASDVLRRIQSQTQYNFLLAQLSVTQPYANVSSVSTQGTAIIHYKNYSSRFNIAFGKYYQNGISTTGFGFIVNSSYIPPTVRIPTFFRTTSNSFTYTGAIQTYTVSSNVTALNMYMWGAGGGETGITSRGRGGGGGFVSGTLTVIPGATYYIVVGGTNRGFGGGGGADGGYTAPGGGGYSGIHTASSRTQGNAVAIAGGGGAGNEAGTVLVVYHGGPGGYIAGSNGQGDGVNFFGGGGGTQSAGGIGGYDASLAGTALQGGNGWAIASDGRSVGGCGSGGGGYWGGGGSRNSGYNGRNAGGGGGSSFIGGLSNVATESGGYAPDSNTSATAGGTASPYWQTPYGNGNNNGYVVILGGNYQ